MAHSFFPLLVQLAVQCIPIGSVAVLCCACREHDFSMRFPRSDRCCWSDWRCLVSAASAGVSCHGASLGVWFWRLRSAIGNFGSRTARHSGTPRRLEDFVLDNWKRISIGFCCTRDVYVCEYACEYEYACVLSVLVSLLCNLLYNYPTIR